MKTIDAILFVGLGNMAGAILDGWLASGLEPGRFSAIDPGRESAPDGVTLLPEAPAQGEFDLVMFGVKPQLLDAVAPTVEHVVGPETVLMSMLAGAPVSTLREHFPRAGAFVRLMPNLAAAIGASPCGLWSDDLDDETRAGITRLVDRLGSAEWLESEELFHPFTALAGSGPGYVYRFIETLARAGADVGLDPGQAERMAVQMVEGAARLAAGAKASPGELARRVASPGGTTQAGLDVLDDGDAMRTLMRECLQAARDRSVEMAGKSSKDG
ncbi:pyrroline-5-carboxylate reductase family protein [Qipengyuania oceanensis]|uniref:Pyrroline-5-carboxylate reductase n=1 Tax=Qipengyuania oceanensis TaxID=1463597 RepID=A0A844YEJ6_9SPHN|nr:pyrroline-5-carboxylate reductase [Qipengyuania oceanensis]MXO62367.1 pyrroline-5-carboxylate reductase [Qipengyuania oceanensis]